MHIHNGSHIRESGELVDEGGTVGLGFAVVACEGEKEGVDLVLGVLLMVG